ncbi:helix-turn-helix domain-containing protein [Mycobacterium sp. E2327]|uniref:helix-turn-helix domain-containing protein n=1 Tax=Mycobacterium sp. E2327 TaxID=1834132 RepID=UPI0009EEEA25|nr:helix-turn-helix domain-containing protein [Mycobacterium sp. E2327]
MKPTQLDIRSAAALLGVHPCTIRRYIAAGILPAHRLGPRLIRISADDVEKLTRQSAIGA